MNGATAFGSNHPIHLGSSSVGSRLAADNDNILGRMPVSDLSENGGGRYDRLAHHQQSPIYKPSVVQSANHGSNGSGTSSKFTANLNMQAMTQAAIDKAENLKTWSAKTYRCTKQILSERLGRGTKTVDVELDAKIQVLRTTKQKYENLAAVSRALSTHISNMIQAQRVLGDSFRDFSERSPELRREFQYNSDTQHVLVRNGENLLIAINSFITGVETLCQRAMEDTLTTVRRYEQARVEYDAYRIELEKLSTAPRNPVTVSKLGEAEVNFNKQRVIFERLHGDVKVKLQFLDENRIQVMQKQLLHFHNAVTAFFAGNQEMLETSLKRVGASINQAGQEKSFLEEHHD